MSHFNAKPENARKAAIKVYGAGREIVLFSLPDTRAGEAGMDTKAPVAVRLRLLGGFELSGAGEVVPRRMVRELIAVLALASPSGCRREDLMTMQWADRGPEQARASLRQALTELRHLLGPDSIVAGDEKVALDRSRVSVDVQAFERLVAAGDLERAAALYAGPLLDGVSHTGGGFADWLLIERTRLGELAARVLSGLLERQTGEAAIATAQRLVQFEPLREDAHRALMRLHAAQGNRSLALRQYQMCRDTLQRELALAPEPETEALFRELQSASGKLAAPPPTGSVERSKALRPAQRWLWPVLAAFVLLAVGFAAFQWRGKTAATGVPYVAVLPFTAIPADPQPERLARGLTEDIITDLARFPEFKVIARHSIAEFGAAADPVAAAEKLSASFVVTGSIQVADGRARIAAQLIDVASGRSLWSKRWDRPSDDIFAIQAEISEQIANRLGGGDGLVQEAGRIAAHRKPPSSLSAYELYLLGTEKLEQINGEDVKEAIRLLQRAVELDPGLARAWVELSNAYEVMAYHGGDPAENYRLSGEAAMQAIALDPGDPEAQFVEGKRLAYANKMVQAKFRFDRALQMAPNQWEIVVFYVAWASAIGEAERGAVLVAEAIRLNPHYPIWAARTFTYAYFMVGRYDEALAMFEKVDEEKLGLFFWPLKAGALAATGRTEEAKQAVERALKAYPQLSVESTVNDPSLNEAERRRVTETMRLAGFPLCATAEALAAIEKAVRLPECR